MEIGERVRQARQARHLSQRELGQRLIPPRSHVAVGEIERGRTRQTLQLLRQIARALDMDYREFLPDVEMPVMMVSGVPDYEQLSPETRDALENLLQAAVALMKRERKDEPRTPAP